MKQTSRLDSVIKNSVYGKYKPKMMYSETMLKQMIQSDVKKYTGIVVGLGDIVKTENGNWEVKF